MSAHVSFVLPFSLFERNLRNFDFFLQNNFLYSSPASVRHLLRSTFERRRRRCFVDNRKNTLRMRNPSADIPHAWRVRTLRRVLAKFNSAPIFGNIVALLLLSPVSNSVLDGLPSGAPLNWTAPYLALVGFIPQRLNCSQSNDSLLLSLSLPYLQPPFTFASPSRTHAITFHVGR